jgi:hypothetical protein
MEKSFNNILMKENFMKINRRNDVFVVTEFFFGNVYIKTYWIKTIRLKFKKIKMQGTKNGMVTLSNRGIDIIKSKHKHFIEKELLDEKNCKKAVKKCRRIFNG